MTVSRRQFLNSAGAAAAGLILAPALAAGRPFARLDDRRRTLIVINLRGGADGLSLLVPYRDPHLRAARPTLALDAPGTGRRAVLDLDGTFGLHPALAPVKPIFDRGQALGIFGVGHANPTRSHFVEQDVWETADIQHPATTLGWANRTLRSTSAHGAVRAVTAGGSFPRLAGEPGVMRIEDIRDRAAHDHRSAVTYPQSELAQNLRDIAGLLRANVGLEIVGLELDGWDTHREQHHRLTALTHTLAEAVAAFWSDVADLPQHITLMTTSEFGRSVVENRTGGTDHGAANAMFVFDNRFPARMSPVSARSTGLAADRLIDGRDLPAEIDFRHILRNYAGACTAG
jgi:uncharacterized protein (DUF1501 family)